MSLKVRAQNVEHAYEIAREFLIEYPEKTPYGNDVPFCVIENRETLSQEVSDIEGSDARK